MQQLNGPTFPQSSQDAYSPSTHPTPPVPPFLLMQNYLQRTLPEVT